MANNWSMRFFSRFWTVQNFVEHSAEWTSFQSGPDKVTVRGRFDPPEFGDEGTQTARAIVMAYLDGVRDGRLQGENAMQLKIRNLMNSE